MVQDSWYSRVSLEFKKHQFKKQLPGVKKALAFETKHNITQRIEAEDKENQLFVHEYHLEEDVSESQDRHVTRESLNKK